MSLRRLFKLCLLTAFAAFGTGFGLDKVFAAPPNPADAEQGTEVLTRGPVHEAFAETVSFDPEAGVVVPKAPPEAIEELAPEQRPEGDNLAWIPGYWAWDDERNDFLWVSGIWRDLPPGRQWVSGYWGQSGTGSQWTSGYWADAQASEVEYLTEPPQSVEEGPNIAAPSPNQTWLPGSWIWQQNRYAWRPGFWSTVQPNWVWVPDHYVSTPRGYVYVDGYWDYSLDRRGILFAPVHFNASVYGQRGFSYSPTTVIDLGALTDNLFLRPNYGHYYFGDYYAASYHDSGFYPWFAYHNHRGYDPFYAHQRWQNRQDRNWDRNIEANFKHRRDHEEDRPPRTWMAQKERLTREGASGKKTHVVAKPYGELAKSQDSPRRFLPLDKQQRQQLGQHGQDLRKFRGERQKLETKVGDASIDKVPRQSGPARVKLPRSPIMGKPAEQFGKDSTPPKRHLVPKPDLKIEPKPRKIGGKAGLPRVGLKETTSNSQLQLPKTAPKQAPTVAPKVTPAKPQLSVPKVPPKERTLSAPNERRNVAPKKKP